MSSLEERLENFPRKRSGDTFERMQAIVDKMLEISMLKSYEFVENLIKSRKVGK